MKNVKVFEKVMIAAGVSAALMFGSAMAGDASTGSSDSGKPTAAAKIAQPAKQLKPQTTCPVMGGDIDKKVYADANGKRVYFCCPMCKETFLKDPEKYIKKLEKMGQGVETVGGPKTVVAGDANIAKCAMKNDSGAIMGCYTCPMHPDVQKKDAGKCPQCGMDLVYKTCTVDSSKAKGGCCKMKK